MTNCIFEKLADRFRCTVCGREVVVRRPGRFEELSPNKVVALCRASGAMPSLASQAAGLAKAAYDFTKSGFKLVDEAEQARRLGICDLCEHKKGGRCGKCGCFLKAKVKAEAWHCPINKW